MNSDEPIAEVRITKQDLLSLYVVSEEEKRRLAKEILRELLGVMTLRQAARWLKWRSPVALGRALERCGVGKIKTSSRIVTYTVPDLIAFREAHRVKGKRSASSVIAAFQPREERNAA